MRALVCELPTKLDPEGSDWSDLVKRITQQEANYVVLGEAPFGSWLPADPVYSQTKADQWVSLHESALESIGRIAPVVISSRPVHAGYRIANEAFAMVDGTYVALHQKHYFPEEEGFFEQTWFTTAHPGFEVHELAGVPTGVSLCTENMFNEWARRYGRLGAHVLAAPRTSGVSTSKWEIALAMAAAVSGSYVLSSNRRGTDGGCTFGGAALIYAPGGELLAKTSAEQPLATVELDFDLVRQAQQDWPCNVPEIAPFQ